MLKKLLLGTVLAGSSMFAATHFSIGIGVGGYGYVPPPVVYAPPVVAYAPPVVYARPPIPGPGYYWVDGYWYNVGPRRLWRAGYWRAPVRSYRVAPRYGYGSGYGYGYRGRH
ncbi:MAG TPA: hypothetical protein VL285_04820 [Bryobacteraceae bacterium]|jgi:hypothetical protein|nr:hypothetical protein [Bryobacteraceae bacterium]